MDDLSTSLFEVREKELTSARASLPQNNFRMMAVKGSPGIQTQDLRDAILEGIRECSAHLNHPLRNIGVSSLDYWAEKIDHQSDPKGWPVVFKNPCNLFFALLKLYTSIRLNGTEAYDMRRKY